MEILTGEQMRQVDQRAIETLGIPSLLLMESAGRGVAEAILRDYPQAGSKGVLVVCGKGSNGGDGLAAARHLVRHGVVPRVLLFARGRELRGDVAVNLQAAMGSGLQVEEILDASGWSRWSPLLEHHGLVLDALLGTGARGAARGLVARVIEDVNACPGEVVSLDLPSGVDADSSSLEGPAVRADRTYTLCRPKLPLVLGATADHAGVWSVVPIGIPDDAVAAVHPELEWLDRAALEGLVPPRPADAHKGSFGHLLAVAGSRGKSGAAVLLGRAALRSGVGLVTIATAASAQPSVAVHQAEIMTEPLPETPSGSLSKLAVAQGVKLLANKDAMALGPGLGAESETLSAALSLVVHRSVPTVVDADGLNALAAGGNSGGSRVKDTGHPLVLTPHPGEAARLLGESIDAVQKDRLEAARRLARQSGAVVVLKGHRTIVAGPDRDASINSTGNPGLATAGTGDVLTGVIGALLARGLSTRDAARLGVFVHGDAGDRAAAEHGIEGMIAGDVIAELPAALEALGSPREPRPW